MRGRTVTLLAALTLAAAIGSQWAAAQAKKESTAEKPKLKADVELALRSEQIAVYKAALQLRALESQYTQTQQLLAAGSAKLREDTAKALKDSGIDAAKYQLDPESLEVTPKPSSIAKEGAEKKP